MIVFKMSKTHYLLVLTITLFSFFFSPFAFAQEEVDTIPFALVEQKPSFNGGDANAFSEWINSKIVYPETAKANNTQGRVTLGFTVGADGCVKDVRVLRGIDPDLDKEAVRVVSSSPKWIPGRQNGEPVNVSFNYPVVFSLPKTSTPTSSSSSQSSPQQTSTSRKTATAEAADKANDSAWLVGTWTVNTKEFGRISLIISGNGQTGRLNFDGEKGSYEVKGSEIRCHIDGDPKDLITVFQIHPGHRLYFGEGYYFNKVK